MVENCHFPLRWDKESPGAVRSAAAKASAAQAGGADSVLL